MADNPQSPDNPAPADPATGQPDPAPANPVPQQAAPAPAPADVEKTELWPVHQLVLEWIKLADVKAAATLAASGVLMTVSFNRILPDCTDAAKNLHLLVLAGLTMIAALVAIWFAFRALIPRLALKGQVIPETLIFFMHIAQKPTAQAYKEAVLQADAENPDWLREQVATQIWANAKVATEKHTAMQQAIKWFGTAVVLCVLLCAAKFYKAVVPATGWPGTRMTEETTGTLTMHFQTVKAAGQ